MAILEDINHDSGGAVSSHWTTVTDVGGRLSTSVASALNGSTEGLQIDYHATNSWTVVEPFVNPSSGVIDLVFYFDPNGAGTPTVGSNRLFRVDVSDNGTTSSSALAQFLIDKETNGDIKVIFNFDDDSGGGGAGSTTVTDEPHKFQFTCIRATGASSNDGDVEFFIDDVSVAGGGGGVDNYDVFALVDFLLVNGLGLEAAMSGTTLYADEFLLTDFAPFLGYDLVLGGGQL